MNATEMVHPNDYDPATTPTGTGTITIEALEHRALYGLFCAMYACDSNPNKENRKRVLEAYRYAEAFVWGADGRFSNRTARKR